MTIIVSSPTIVAQVSGTPGRSDIFDPVYGNPWGFELPWPGGFPSWSADTRNYDVFSGDLGFAWDDQNGGVITAYGDSDGFNWKGPFAATGGGGSTTVNVNSAGVHLETLNGSSGSIVYINSTAGIAVNPFHAAVRLNNGYFGYFAFQGIASFALGGFTFFYLTNCFWLGGTGGGPNWVLSGNETLSTTDGGWGGGLVNGTHTGHRDNIIFRSTDKDLTNGHTITSVPNISSAGTAVEVIPSGNAGNSTNSIFNTGVPFISITSINWIGFPLCTVTTASPHGLPEGQFISVTSNGTTSNGQYMIFSVSSNQFSFFGGGSSFTTSNTGTIFKAFQPLTAARDPKHASIDLCPPCGGIAIPGVGVGGATRQYLFYQRMRLLNPFGASAMMGVTYSDDGGATWTDASQSTLIDVFNTTYSGPANIGHISILQGNAAGTFPFSGVVEIDTSQGNLAYLSYSFRSNNQLTITSLIRGNPTDTIDGSCGMRVACWANNQNYTAHHQQGWPWRPGDGYVYLFTTRCNRIAGGLNGSAAMCRVPEASILDKSAWTYWDGTTWNTNPESATNIFPDSDRPWYQLLPNGVGEPGWFYHSGLSKYVASYVVVDVGIVVRFADNPEGPWSDQQVLINLTGIYGGFPHPWSTLGVNPCPTGPSGTVTTSVSGGNQQFNDFYFHVSLADPYATYLFHCTMTNITPPQAPATVGGISLIPQVMVQGLN